MLSDIVWVILITSGVVYLLVDADGPFHIMASVRCFAIRGHVWHLGVLGCKYCSSFWVTLVITILYRNTYDWRLHWGAYGAFVVGLHAWGVLAALLNARTTQSHALRSLIEITDVYVSNVIESEQR